MTRKTLWNYNDNKERICIKHNISANWQKSRFKKSGGSWYCSLCRNERNKERYHNPKPKQERFYLIDAERYCKIHNVPAKQYKAATSLGYWWDCPECRKEKHNKDIKRYKTEHPNLIEYHLRNMYKNAKYDSKKINRDFTITTDYILQLWKSQNGKCAITGLDMDIIPGNNKINPNKCTIDRIDSSKGYIPENIWLVCSWANTSKNNLNSTQLKIFCTGIMNNINRIETAEN